MTRRKLAGREWMAVLVLLLAAAALRVARFETAPPGVIHDEVLNWLNSRLILSGDIRALYPYGGGREGLYLFIQTATFELFGHNLIASRFPSLAFNLIGMCALFSLTRRMMGQSGALVAMAAWAGAFWPLMFSRLGVRTGSMPAMALVAGYLLVRGVAEARGLSPLSKDTKGCLSQGINFISMFALCVKRPSPSHPSRDQRSRLGFPSPVQRGRVAKGRVGVFSESANEARGLSPLSKNPKGRLSQGINFIYYRQVILGGLVLGLTLYTYPAALMLPVIFLVWALLHPKHMRERWRGLALAFLIAGLMAIPLALAWRDPSSTARAAAIDAPLEALLAGNPDLVIDNILPILGNFTVAGDHGLEFNLQSQPIFPQPPLAALFYAGLIIAAWRVLWYRDNRYSLLLLWLGGMMLPTLATHRPVNPSRTIGLMSVVFIFPAVVMAEVRNLSHNKWLRGVLAGVTAAALLWQFAATARGYFVDWATNPVVKFLYQEDYRILAADWDATPPQLPTALGGLTPDRMDPVTMRLLLDDDALAESLGYFDPQTALLLPGGEECLVVIPRFVTLHPALAAWLEPRTIAVKDEAAYRIYHIDPPPFSEEALFARPGGAEVVLLGSERIAGEAQPGQTLTIATLWRAESASLVELRLFVHLTDEAGNILAQSDALGVPATQWRAGDVIIQAHDLTLPDDAPPGPYWLTMGVYDPASGERLRAGEEDFVRARGVIRR